MLKVGVIGATGYVGVELVRLLATHPEVELTLLTSESYSGKRLSDVYPSLGGFCELELSGVDHVRIAESCDVAFVALPHGHGMEVVPPLLDAGLKVIDMGADFRLKDPRTYEQWYEKPHRAPGYLDRSVYGLPEANRDAIRKARLVANPGCYPTSAILAALPLLRARAVKPGRPLIVDSKSGVSGAGRGLSPGVHFSEVNENFKAYSVGGVHRHTPEMEEQMSAVLGSELKVCFTPYLVPMTRGILSTLYLEAPAGVSGEYVQELYQDAYAGESFVKYLPEGLPQTKHVYASNMCHLAVKYDQRTGTIVAISAIDNLVKGAAGQAIQNMNLMFGLPETVGLAYPGIFP